MALDEQVEDSREQLGGDAGAVVLDPDDDFAAGAVAAGALTRFAPRAHRDLSAALRVAGGVGEQVRHHLGEPHRIAVDPQPFIGDLEGEVVIALLEEIARHLDRLGDHLGDFDPLLAQLHLPAGDLRDVEEIVDQPGEVIDLSLDHLLFPGGSRVASQLHQLQRGGDGGERVAQLVAQHGQKLVLGPAGSFQFGKELLVLGLRSLQHLPGPHLLGDLDRHRHHPVHLVLGVAERLHVELEIAVLARAVVLQILGDQVLLGAERLAGLVDAIENFAQPPLLGPGEHLRVRLADDVVSSHHPTEQRVGESKQVLGAGEQRGPDRCLQEEVVSLAVRRRLDAEGVDLGLGEPEMIHDLGQVISIAVIKRQPRAQAEHDEVAGALPPRMADGNDEQRRGGLRPVAPRQRAGRVAREHHGARLPIAKRRGAQALPHGRVHRRGIGEACRPHEPKRT